MRSIVLIGMPGSGKSTTGVLLAKTLGMPFVDTDLLIQQREQRLLQDIIKEEGLDDFKQIEREVVGAINFRNTVVATGGSVVYYEEVMAHLKNLGKILYLQLPFPSIEERINNIHTRGIAMGEGQSLQQIYEERKTLYEKYADIIIDCKGLSVELTIEKMVQLLKVIV